MEVYVVSIAETWNYSSHLSCTVAALAGQVLSVNQQAAGPGVL